MWVARTSVVDGRGRVYSHLLQHAAVVDARGRVYVNISAGVLAALANARGRVLTFAPACVQRSWMCVGRCINMCASMRAAVKDMRARVY